MRLIFVFVCEYRLCVCVRVVIVVLEVGLRRRRRVLRLVVLVEGGGSGGSEGCCAPARLRVVGVRFPRTAGRVAACFKHTN